MAVRSRTDDLAYQPLFSNLHKLSSGFLLFLGATKLQNYFDVMRNRFVVEFCLTTNTCVLFGFLYYSESTS
jgi:hypothetical protein